MKVSKRYVEKCLTDLLRELEACPPALLAEIIVEMMAVKGYGEDEAIRELAEMKMTTKHLLDAIRSVGEA